MVSPVLFVNGWVKVVVPSLSTLLSGSGDVLIFDVKFVGDISPILGTYFYYYFCKL